MIYEEKVFIIISNVWSKGM